MRLKPVLFAVFLSCAPLEVWGEQADDALLQSLYARSGMQVQVQQLPATVGQAFDQRLAVDPAVRKFSNKVIAAVRGGLRAVFVPEVMKATILKEIGARLSHDDVKAALAWLDSPLGTKIAKLEEAASGPDFVRKMPQFMEKIRREPPPQSRLDAIRRLDTAVRATEISVDIFIASALASSVALSSIGPQDKRVSVPELRTAIEGSRPQINRLMSEQVKAAFLYTYTSLPDSDLNRYLAYAESPVGKKYHRVMGAAMAKAVFQSILRLESAIDDELKDRKA